MVQHVKVIVTKSDDLGLILRNHMVEEKNKYLHIVFCPVHDFYGHTLKTNQWNKNLKKNKDKEAILLCFEGYPGKEIQNTFWEGSVCMCSFIFCCLHLSLHCKSNFFSCHLPLTIFLQFLSSLLDPCFWCCSEMQDFPPTRKLYIGGEGNTHPHPISVW